MSGIVSAEEDGLNSSLKHLRSILMIDAASNAGVVKFEEQIKHLEGRLKEERSLRAKQETSYEALSKYNKELSLQLDAVTKLNQTNEDKYNSANRSLQSEKTQLDRKQTEWTSETDKLKNDLKESQNESEKNKTRCLYFQQQIEELKTESKELKADIVKLKSEIEANQNEYKERLQDETNKQDELKKQMKETKDTLEDEVSIWLRLEVYRIANGNHANHQD